MTVAEVQDAAGRHLAALADGLSRRSVARIDAARFELREVRASLDALDVAAEARGSGAGLAAGKLARLTWERDMRHALVRADGAADAVREALVIEARGRRRLRHVIRHGDTLHSLAVRYLGAWSEWTRIAAHNGIGPADELVAGAVLEIPDRG